jgi:hypothetical protein
MPRSVNLSGHLKSVPPFIRRLFWVYYTFVGLVLVSFGTLTFAFAEEIARGEPVARGLCILMAVFWMVRLVCAVFVFDVRPYLTSALYRIGYQATNAVFGYLLGIYLWAAIFGG